MSWEESKESYTFRFEKFMGNHLVKSPSTGSSSTQQSSYYSQVDSTLRRINRAVAQEVSRIMRESETSFVEGEKIPWNVVAESFENMSGEECRDLWLKHHPNITLEKRGNTIVAASIIGYYYDNSILTEKKRVLTWTREEEEMALRLHKILGNRWKLIAAKMNSGKSGYDIKCYIGSKEKVTKNL